MPKLFRVTLLLLLLSLIALPSSALDIGAELLSDNTPDIQQDESDEATVRVIPNEAEVGSNHTILITGLSANQSVTVRIVFDGNSSSVYETNQVADSRGIVEISIFTEASDSAGDYTVEVLNSSDVVIGSATLLLLEATSFNTEINVDPLEAEAGTTFTIDITDVRPFAILDVTIENEDNNEVFTQRLRASVDGDATIEFESSDSTTGNLNVIVVEGETRTIAEAQITVLGQVFPATIVLEPVTALPGDTVFVTISGLEAERDVTVDVSIDDETIATIEETSNVSGLIIFPFDLDAEAEFGRYTFSVIDDNVLVGQEILRVEIPPTDVTITPTVGTIGTTFFVTVSGLRPDEEVIIDLTQSGEVIQSFTTTADENGDARAGLGQRIELELGFYGVQVTRFDSVVFTAPVEVAEERPPTPITINPEDVSVSVIPETGIIPTEYTLLVEGLPADTNITLFILLDGQSVLSLSGTADENGSYTTVITSEASDPPGVYTLEVRAEGNVIGSFDFEIADEEADAPQDDEETTEAPVGTGDASLLIDPVNLRQGERIEFVISELTPEETVIFELSFDGEVIYMTEATADGNGLAGVALLARDDEPLGEYQVRILRGEEAIASNTFAIVDSNMVLSEAQLTVEPETASAGSDYAIIVTGLEPEETVEVSVSLEGDTIFEDERVANSEGTVTVVLSSDSGDELGLYDVLVTHDDGELTATLTITEADAETAEAQAEELSLSISPDSGEIGTDHEIEVTGLEPNEAFTLVIEYDGDEVYSAEQAADDNGNFNTVISTVDSDPLGEYTIIIDREGDDISEILSVVSDDAIATTPADFEVSVDKEEVDAQEAFEVTVSGLEANETVTIEVEFDDEVVYETDRNADNDGIVTLALSTDEGDPEGTYIINVLRGEEVVSIDVVVLGAEEVASTNNNEIQIRVSPNSGEIGTEYEFIVTGLNSNETFDLAVEFDGDIVFEDTRTADGSGIFTITLETSESDDAGEYIFRIIRENDPVSSVTFIVEDSEGTGAVEETTNNIPDENETADPADDVITYADGVSIEFNRNTSVQVVEFEGQAGDVISVSVDSNDTVDTVAILFDPNGVEIASDDDGGVGFDPEIERAVLPVTGTYTVEIRPFTVGDTGEAQVTISRNDLRTLDEEEVRTVVLNSKVTTDILTFEGEAGDVINLVLELESGEIGAFVVLAIQDGNTLMRYETFGLPESISLGFVVPEDGNVTISIEDDGSNSAVINARISKE